MAIAGGQSRWSKQTDTTNGFPWLKPVVFLVMSFNIALRMKKPSKEILPQSFQQTNSNQNIVNRLLTKRGTITSGGNALIVTTSDVETIQGSLPFSSSLID